MHYPRVVELLEGHMALQVSWKHWSRLVFQVIFSPDDDGFSEYARRYTITSGESRRLLQTVEQAEEAERYIRSDFATLLPHPLGSFHQLEVLDAHIAGPWYTDSLFWDGCYGVCCFVIDHCTPVEFQLRWMVDYLSSCAECQSSMDSELDRQPSLAPRFH